MLSLRIITVASTLLLMSSQMTGAAAEPMTAPEYEWYDWRNMHSFTLTAVNAPVQWQIYTQTEPDYSSIVLAEDDAAILNFTSSALWADLPLGWICACITMDSGLPIGHVIVPEFVTEFVPVVGPIISAEIPEPASTLLILLGCFGILASRKIFVN